MADDFRIGSRQSLGVVDLLQEGVPAEARILLEPVARRHVTDAVAEDAAQVAHLLLEEGRRAVGVVFGVEEQWMTTLNAHVFVASVAFGQPFILMLTEEARQCVPHASHRAVLAKILGPATAPPVTLSRLPEDVVVDMMPPERAGKFG
jgi:hypothetical protein